MFCLPLPPFITENNIDNNNSVRGQTKVPKEASLYPVHVGMYYTHSIEIHPHCDGRFGR